MSRETEEQIPIATPAASAACGALGVSVVPHSFDFRVGMISWRPQGDPRFDEHADPAL
jgi:hypothetical protein